MHKDTTKITKRPFYCQNGKNAHVSHQMMISEFGDRLVDIIRKQKSAHNLTRYINHDLII